MENKLSTSGFVVQPRLQFKNLKDKMLYQMLIEEANYIASNRCNIGQTIVVLTNLSKETGWSRDVIKGALERLKESGYIEVETLPQKRGILVTLTDYKKSQSLTYYQKEKGEKEPKNPQEEPQEEPHEIPQENPHESESCNPCESKEEDMSKITNPQEESHENPQEKPHEIPHTITAFITAVNSNNINKTLKEYVASAPVKNKNLSATDEIETFVDFASLTNALPNGINKKLLVSYFDCIRLTRQTCTISANILVNILEKIKKYSANQINYSLWNHIENHDAKNEKYTLGILRNVKEPEARRGLMKLKNKGGSDHAKHGSYPAAVGETESSTSKETQRLEAIARERGLHGAIRDVDVDF